MMDRKRFLSLLTKSGGALIAAAVAVPAAITAFSPAILRRREKEVWAAVGSLPEFPPESVSKAVVKVPWNEVDRPLAEKGVFVWRPSESEVVVFSKNCTDLSCPVTWDPGSGWFFCPCHGGMFSEDGTNVAGPPSRPLYRYANRVRDGILEIDLNSLPPMT